MQGEMKETPRVACLTSLARARVFLLLFRVSPSLSLVPRAAILFAHATDQELGYAALSNVQFILNVNEQGKPE